jgi:uncharacterized protein YbjT (DUF2867 family)
MLVVSGGSGRVARAVTAALAAAPGSKRLGLLKPAAAAGFAPAFALKSAALNSPQDRARLMAGASNLVLIPSFDQRVTEQQMGLAAMARDAGIQRIHVLSAAGADPRSPVTLLRWLGLLEREVLASGLPHTILRCMPYMQSIPLFMRRETSGWKLVGPFRDAAFAWLDAYDAGTVIANRLGFTAGENLACAASGPEEWNFEAVAEHFAVALGEPVRYVDIGRPEAAGMLEANGVAPGRIRAITEYWDYLASGVVRCGCCQGADALLGRPRRTLAAYLREYASELLQAA